MVFSEFSLHEARVDIGSRRYLRLDSPEAELVLLRQGFFDGFNLFSLTYHEAAHFFFC